MRTRELALLVAVVLAVVLPISADTCSTTDQFQQTPLTDFAPTQTYKGLAGFLYEGSNQVPFNHDLDGKKFAAEIQPLDTNGNPCLQGQAGCEIVFLSIGFSNNTVEFCGGKYFYDPPENDDPAATACAAPLASPPYNEAISFLGQAFNDPQVNHTSVVLVDGASANQGLPEWDPTDCRPPRDCFHNYNRVRDKILHPSGLSEEQVQSVYVYAADLDPRIPISYNNSNASADADTAEMHLGNILRAIKTRYPNIKQVFVCARNYGGYANTRIPENKLNPEPFAYEIGFSVKWLIQAQINQIGGEGIDPVAGNLDYSVAPWVVWGPYYWASGNTPRSDGLTWPNMDFRGTDPGLIHGNECTHPSIYGEVKTGGLLLNFMKTSPYTTWFLATQSPAKRASNTTGR